MRMDTSGAKNIFIRYRGSHSAMANDGVYEKYKSYGISPATEAEWLTELRSTGSESGKPEDFKRLYREKVSFVRKAKDVSALPELLKQLSSENAMGAEPLHRLYAAETYLDALNFFKINRYDIEKFIPGLKGVFVSIGKSISDVDMKARYERDISSLNHL